MTLPDITVYPVRRLITMNPALLSAEAVAISAIASASVRSMNSCAGATTAPTTLSETMCSRLIRRGPQPCDVRWYVEHVYVGFFDRRSDRSRMAWLQSIDEVVARLREADAAMTDRSDHDLLGLDLIYLTGERLVGRHLDAVSERRQIFILHASGHLATVNSAVIRHDNITADNPTPGIQLDEYGQPNGELQEPAAMSLASGQRMLREVRKRTRQMELRLWAATPATPW